MKLSAKTGVALAITALSLVVTVGPGAAGSSIRVDDNWLGRGPASARVLDVEGSSGSATALTPQPDPLTEKGPIPYLSHGIGVDQSLWGGQVSLVGLTGDSPITRVVGQEPAGLTGDSPRTRGQVFQANDTFASNGNVEVNWTWVGFGAGMAALLAAAMGALYLSARHRDRVALP
jgi:hypothetical protein